MKKFLLSILLAFAIIIPTAAVAEAADIPDIRQINSSIRPDISIFYTNSNYYSYTCNNGNKYAMLFAQMLVANYPFKVVERFVDDEYPEWYLAYTGSKKVAPNKEWFNAHVLISSSNSEIEILIGKGLSYAGHFVKDY